MKALGELAIAYLFFAFATFKKRVTPKLEQMKLDIRLSVFLRKLLLLLFIRRDTLRTVEIEKKNYFLTYVYSLRSLK